MSDHKPAVFTRDNPVTKVHIWNAFAAPCGTKAKAGVPVVEVRAKIGLNAPKYLIRENYISLRAGINVDTYVMSKLGWAWLHTGLLRHLELHPGDLAKCDVPPPSHLTEWQKLRQTASSGTRTRRLVRR